MDARYWKEFENMGDTETDKRSGSDEPSSRYSKDSKKSGSSRRKRSRSNTRSRSSSSSSSGSSSRSSSSSSRRHSDERSYRSRKVDTYRRKSPSRIRSSGYGSTGCEKGGNGWFSQGHNYPTQTQDINTSSSYLPPSYAQGPPPVPGQYPPNCQAPNFGNNFHSYPGGGYEPPGNYYPPNFPHGSRPPPTHEYPPSGGPSNHGRPPGSQPPNWEMFHGQLPPPIHQTQNDGIPGLASDLKSEEAKKEAIQQELIQQKKTFSIQREDYIRRKFSLNRELNRLKDQKRDLVKEKSKDNERILRENAKLQGEIQQKLKSMDSVIEMLTNIIGDSARLPDIIKEIKIMEKEKSEKPKKSEKKKRSPQTAEERCKASADKDISTQDSQDENRIYYDPGLHWCSECDIFPKTVTEYLDHLHTPEHKKKSTLKFENYPWHTEKNLREMSPQFNKDAPSRRIPIRGVQFLVPATAWFCSICNMWLGDNHCASKHVQSTQHSNNYNEFILRNPHWEVDWLTERTRSYERNSEAKQPQVLRSLSDQLFAMIKANSKKHEPPVPAPPPPPPLNSTSSSSEDDSLDRKYKKKSKKSKKKLNKDNASSIAPSTKEVSLTSEQIKLNYKSIPEIKIVPVEDSFISEWMPRVVKHVPVHLTKRPRDEDEERRPKKIARHASVGSSEMSSDTDKKSSPYDYNDQDDAIIFNKRATSNSKELKNKRKFEEERSSRYNSKESSKEKSKYDDKYKYKGLDKYNKYERELKYEDHKEKRDSKTFKEPAERNKKSPMRKTKDGVMKKKIKSKLDNKSDEDTHETSFEKRTSESAAKKKDVKKMVLNNLPKTKLPFIGRMPILKKKVDQKPDEKEEKKENLEEEVMKDVIPSISSEVNVPEVITTNEGESSVEELPKSTLIISKRPRLAEPGIVRKEILFNKPANDNLTEQDMELDEEIGGTKDEEPAKDELHKDFKDALELLFPEEKKAEEGQETVTQVESEIKLEEQPQVVAAAGSYIMPAGYEVGMYPTYYEQHAYIQQQWAQMGYDQTGQYAGAYAYPPPMEQQPLLEIVQPSPVIEVLPPEPPKKKKNPLSQRMRRHLKKKKEKEAQKDNAGIEEDTVVEGEDLEEDEEEVSAEGKPSNNEDDLKVEQEENRPSDMSDLAMLGIDEDDAAAQGLC